MIVLKNVFVKFANEFFSLFDSSFSINCNTFLIEKNLCGATAFFRTLSRINQHYEGEILIDNVNLKNIKTKNLSISYLTKNPILFNNKSIEYNLSFPLKIKKINKKTIKNTVNSMIFTYNLQNFNKKVKNLSNSEKKIICLVRALIKQPKYVLLENFFDDLNENYVELALKILKDICKNSIVIAYEEHVENQKYFESFSPLYV